MIQSLSISKRISLPLFFSAAFFFSIHQLALAGELPCGNIIAPEEVYDFAGSHEDLTTISIESCEDPFGVTIDPPSPYTLVIDGTEVASGGIFVQDVPIRFIGTDGMGELNFTQHFLFKHDGDDYVYFNQYPAAPTEDDYINFANTYFATAEEAEQYLTILFVDQEFADLDEYFYDEEYELLIDINTGESIEERYYSFLNALNNYLDNRSVTYEPGTYTLLIKEFELIFSLDSVLQKVREFFVKTAYAEAPSGPYFYTITFTIVDTPPEPTGASSVLFLPGIMGSSLYEESSECGLGEDPYIQTRWPTLSVSGCNISRLNMTSLGISENDIFTTQEDGVIEDIGSVVNLYEAFIEDLAEWKASDLIADYRAVPYDWRLSLYDILKAHEVDGRIVPNSEGTYQDGYIYQSLVELVEASPAEKVVLVGHSNGGLVIRALLASMKENDDPLLESIDKVVLVAVPQVGTPESVVGILHGVTLDPIGYIFSHEESRKLMNTSPFAYHLLPSEEYYDLVVTPVITFETGTATDPFISQFGDELDTLEEVNTFLSKESGRVTPAWNDVATPATAYSHLLGYAESLHAYLEDWRPEETKVYEVGGVGINTPATLEYFTDTKCVRYVQNHFSRKCDEFESKVSYRVNEVIDGDGTVVIPSAMAASSEGELEKLWVNLDEYAGTVLLSKVHKDILEIKEVRELISDFVSTDVYGSHDFISNFAPDFSDENRLLLRLHSPLDIFVVLHDEKVVGSSTPLLRGVEYRRYGEIQHLSIPEGEEDYEIRLVGLAEGSFTLEIENYEGNVLEERVTFSAIPSDAETKVIVSLEDEESLDGANVLVDYNGDGVFDTFVVPGLSNTTTIESDIITPITKASGGSTGTKIVKDHLLKIVPAGLLTSNIEVNYTEIDTKLLLQFIEILTQYRDLLIKLKVQ